MNNHYRDEARIDRGEVLTKIRDLQERYLLNTRQHLSDEASKYLYRGFGVRLLMIRHAVIKLDTELSNADGPIDYHLSVELTLLLNSIYLNLAGGLDNLAWALAHQYGLVAANAEKDRKERMAVVLTGNEFLKNLACDNPELQTFLKPFQDWYKDLRQFRDPGAHRIPLFIPAATLSEADLETRKDLDTKAAAHYAEDDHYSGGSTMREMSKLGEFYPIFTADLPEINVYNVGPRLTEDLRQFFAIAATVYDKGLNLPSKRFESKESFENLQKQFAKLMSS